MIKPFLLLCAFYSIFGWSQGWQQLGDFPLTARDDGASFVIGDTAYCGTGLNSWWVTEGDFSAFNMQTETWININTLPTGKERQYASGFSNNQKGYIFGGVNGSNFLTDLWMYDPTTGLWSEKTPLPSFGRSGSSCFVINDTAYIIGGKSATLDALDQVWAYSILNDTWAQKASMSFGSRWRASATAIGNIGYVTLGVDELNGYHNELYKYDAGLDSWNTLASFPSIGRSQSSLVEIGNQLHLLFGSDENGIFYNDLWTYDTVNNTWSSLQALPSSERKGGTPFSGSGKLFYTTGIDANNTRLKETWKYDPFLTLKENTQANFTIYPNPATSVIYINAEIKAIEKIQVYSLTGLLLTESFNQNTINVKHLNSGSYILLVEGDFGTQRSVFLKI